MARFYVAPAKAGVQGWQAPRSSKLDPSLRWDDEMIETPRPVIPADPQGEPGLHTAPQRIPVVFRVVPDRLRRPG
jgi:hypothetical protein